MEIRVIREFDQPKDHRAKSKWDTVFSPFHFWRKQTDNDWIQHNIFSYWLHFGGTVPAFTVVAVDFHLCVSAHKHTRTHHNKGWTLSRNLHSLFMDFWCFGNAEAQPRAILGRFELPSLLISILLCVYFEFARLNQITDFPSKSTDIEHCIYILHLFAETTEKTRLWRRGVCWIAIKSRRDQEPHIGLMGNSRILEHPYIPAGKNKRTRTLSHTDMHPHTSRFHWLNYYHRRLDAETSSTIYCTFIDYKTFGRSEIPKQTSE